MSEFDNWKEEQERIHNDYDAENAWYAGQQSQQAKIDELQKLRSLDEMAINQLAQANQVWQIKCDGLKKKLDCCREENKAHLEKIDELQARINSLTNINESLVAYKNQLLDELEEKGNKDEN